MSKFLPHELKFLSQFNDNVHCTKALQLAITYLDKPDDNKENLLRRLAYVTAVSSQSIEDDVFIAAMLHPLAEYKATDLSVLMTGLGYEALKVVQAIRETQDAVSLYDRISNLDSKYLAIVVARVMYRLIHIDVYDYPDAVSILEEAKTYTVKLDAPLDIMVQLNILISQAQRVFNELYEVQELEEKPKVISDGDEEHEASTQNDQKDYISHKRLADELGIAHKEVRTLEGIGKVTYYNCVGFCDANGELVNLSKNVQDTSTSSVPADSTKSIDTISTVDSVEGLSTKEFQKENTLHLTIAKALGAKMDNQVIQLGTFGNVVYREGVGFFKDNKMVILSNTIYDTICSEEEEAESVKTPEIDIQKRDEHRRVARLMGIENGTSINIINLGKCTYSEEIGFIDELGNVVELSAMSIK